MSGKFEVFSDQAWPISLTEVDANDLAIASMLSEFQALEQLRLNSYLQEFSGVSAASQAGPELKLQQPGNGKSFEPQAWLSLEAALDDSHCVMMAANRTHPYFENRKLSETQTNQLHVPVTIKKSLVEKISLTEDPSEEPFLTSVAFMIGEGSRFLMEAAGVNTQLAVLDYLDENPKTFWKPEDAINPPEITL